MSKLVRILAVVFLAAFAASASAHAAASTDMSLKMSMSGMDDGRMSDCQDCPGEDTRAGNCDQFCVTIHIAPGAPSGADLPRAADVVAMVPESAIAGRAGPPDLHPPRTII